MPINIPNTLTLARFFLVPFFIGIFYFPIKYIDENLQNLIATGIFILSAITDWLDGWLARKLNQTSAWGAFLDPVVDKILVCSALVILVQLGRLDASIAIIIIGREIGISALREWMAILGASNSVAVSYAGKLKTATQMLAIPFLLSQKAGTLAYAGSILIYIASMLTIYSMFMYFKCAIYEINKNTDKQKASKSESITCAN